MNDTAASGQDSAEPWTPLCRLDQIEVGRALYIEREGGALSVVRTASDEAIVIDDTCPHAGMSLSGGQVQDECIVCPWHAWEFRVSDGRCPDNESIAVARHPSRVRDGVVEVPMSVMRPGNRCG